MKKTYQNPVAERIEFDYTDTITASGTYHQDTYRDSNENYDCHSSLTPDQACGYNGVHTSNVGYICGVGQVGEPGK